MNIETSSLAPWELALCELTLRLRTVVVSAGSVGAGSLAPCKLTSYLRTVVVAASSLRAGSPAPCERCQHPLPLKASATDTLEKLTLTLQLQN